MDGWQRLARKTSDVVSHLLGKLIGEADEEPPNALPLMGGEGKDTGQIIAHVRVLLLGEISHRVEATVIILAQHIEQERVLWFGVKVAVAVEIKQAVGPINTIIITSPELTTS